MTPMSAATVQPHSQYAAKRRGYTVSECRKSATALR